MNFSSILGMLSAGSIGVVAGGVFGLPFQSKAITHENNQQPEPIPQVQEESKPVLTFNNSLSKDQADILKTVWRNGDRSNKHLVDYFDYEGWMNKAKQYSLLKEKWPGDIIFIADKSDKNLGEKLRDKCYSAAQWFFLVTRSDNNTDVEDFMKNIYGNFSLEKTKELCATDKDTLPTEIKSVTRRTFSGLGGYKCKNEATSDEQWIKEVYDTKKTSFSSYSMCQIIQDSAVTEIEYTNGTKKYQFLKSRSNSSNSGFVSIPGDGEIYSSILEIPGISDLFEPIKNS